MPGWDGSTRRARLPADWPARREACRQRAAGRCEWARVLRAVPELAAWWRKRGGDHDPAAHPGHAADHIHRDDNHDDLAWLCRDHHASKSGWEGGTASGTNRRPPEPHPGLL